MTILNSRVDILCSFKLIQISQGKKTFFPIVDYVIIFLVAKFSIFSQEKLATNNKMKGAKANLSFRIDLFVNEK